MMRCMQRTNIYLEARQTEALDRLAAAEGVSRAEMIRRLIDHALIGTDDLHSDLAAIEAAFGVAPDLEIPDRAPGSREEHLDGVWRAAS